MPESRPASRRGVKAAVGDEPDASLTEDLGDLKSAIVSLNMLRAPLPPNEVEKLPKPMWKGAWDQGRKAKCDECGGYHVVENTIHLDYFGHARTTGRLLEADLFWDWEPMVYDDRGFPMLDEHGGLWILLTVCGVTRKGYGHANGRRGADATKEIIGDAIRNAAMRFGVALELWSKGETHDGKNPTVERQSDRSRAQSNNRRADAAPTRAVNQDALDDLLAVCADEGLDARSVAERFAREHEGHTIERASVPDIEAFTQKILGECVAEPAEPAGGEEPAAGRDDTNAGGGQPETDAAPEEPAVPADAGRGATQARITDDEPPF